jgi:glucose/mannose-6-phosphate isomerase
MMSDAIKNFPKQFEFEPKIENEDKLQVPDGGYFERFAVLGMGGSHWSADLLKTWDPGLDIIIRSDYGVPEIADWEKTPRLYIISSYSGNTEEPLDGLEQARQRHLPLLAIATGNKLIERARHHQLPYIQIPNTGIQPRCALGFGVRAMMKAMRLNEGLRLTSELAGSLKPEKIESVGRSLANTLKNRIPVIYASSRNIAIVYNWKIKFNETGKIPAFCNVFPELNHNEMNGFDVKSNTRFLSENFHFIFLSDNKDDPRVKRRMEITRKLYEDRGLLIKTIDMEGDNPFQKIFSSLLLADWTAYYTAEGYGLESEQVPMVEEFKKIIAS